jgi:hypothetical protein
VGNTFGNAENFRSLLHDVETKLFDRLPDDTWFHPGARQRRDARQGAAGGAARGW